jgi:hypothetical protein
VKIAAAVPDPQDPQRLRRLVEKETSRYMEGE